MHCEYRKNLEKIIYHIPINSGSCGCCIMLLQVGKVITREKGSAVAASTLLPPFAKTVNQISTSLVCTQVL
ncbi:hypothetical protein LguiB_019826 [Lonicera macranthoides]